MELLTLNLSSGGNVIVTKGRAVEAPGETGGATINISGASTVIRSDTEHAVVICHWEKI